MGLTNLIYAVTACAIQQVSVVTIASLIVAEEQISDAGVISDQDAFLPR